jgi:hypothetical protein
MIANIAMSMLKAAWEPWHPETGHDREEILVELQEVLASPHFCNSKRYPALLKYVVEISLAGKADLLKERTLGVEVFHRPPDYDTNADTVVRYTAGEVRKRLSLYYHEHDSRLQISLPAGSYVPEFLCAVDDARERPRQSVHPIPVTSLFSDLRGAEISSGPASGFADVDSGTAVSYSSSAGMSRAGIRWLWVGAVAILLILAGIGWRHRTIQPQTAVDQFWAPVMRGPGTTLICSGGVVFEPRNFSGVQTAGKDIEYPFVSMQIAAAIGKVSGLLERGGATVQMQSCAPTPLTEMRERPVVLLGGYNNEWTLRLQSPLRYQFSPESIAASIVDREQPQVLWARDRTLPYSSADDYALAARFRNTTTDGVVVMLAGLGRNGTEAAAQFVTSPHYMELLKEKVGSSALADKNIEVVLKISVIEGKTGAPSIEAVQVW